MKLRSTFLQKFGYQNDENLRLSFVIEARRLVALSIMLPWPNEF